MPLKFYFTAKDWNGNKIKGTLPAENRQEALSKIYSRKLVPLEVKEQRFLNLISRMRLLALFQMLGFRYYNSRDLMIFCRQLSTMLKAGVSIMHALDVLSGQMENKAIQARLKAASLALEQGSDLSGALAGQEGFFPPLLVNMIGAGEAGGMLDTVTERIALHYENQHDMEEKIRSATAYPLLITVVAFIVVLVMVIFVLPQFASIFNSMGMEMPLFSRIMLTAGEGALTYRYYILFALIVLFTCIKWSAGTEKGRFRIDYLRLYLPLYGKIYRQNAAARFARTLGTLLAGGLSLHKALQLTDKVIGNTVISAAITDLSEALSSGETIASPMSTCSCFPPLLVEMVRVGEETGTLTDTLHRAALFYEKETSYLVDRLGSVLEPVLLLAVGLFIGLLVFSILSPMYQVFEMI